MKRANGVLVALLAVTALAGARTVAPGEALPPPVVPEGFGVNIHFTDPQPGEMERFKEAGYRIARMDLFWNQIERKRGEYDFSAYDRLVDHLAKAGARPLFILDYGNDLYQQGSPSTPEARAAFTRFASAAASRYKGRGVIFEIWNEPNISFWKPKPNAADYAKLALETAQAVHKADPNATVVAPGSSGFPWEFFEEVFASGLLAHLDAVSVHPYRGDEPETAAADYAQLRGLIARYAPPAKRQLPIISSEWGYSTWEGGNISEATQARFLTRMWLANLASGVNLSIFYDWRDDGDDPKENEHRFGTVRRDFTPKPSFTAAKALIAQLSGYSFRHRLAGKDANDWRLLFQKGDTDELTLVTWNAAKDAPEAEAMPTVRPVKSGDPDFDDLRTLAAFRFAYGPLAQGGGANGELTVTVLPVPPLNKTDSVLLVYPATGPGARPPAGGDAITLMNQQIGGPDGLKTPLRRTVGLPLNLRRQPFSYYTVGLRVGGRRLPDLAPVTVARMDPLSVSVAPTRRELTVVLENPSGVALNGELRLTPQGKAQAFRIARGQKHYRATLPWSGKGTVGISVRDTNGLEIAAVSEQRYEPLAGWPTQRGKRSSFSRVLFVENVAQKPEPLVVAPTPDRSPAENAVKFDYQFDTGWRYAQMAPDKPLAIPKDATTLILWVYSDGSGDHLRSRFRDSTGQTFQKDLGQLTWRGWRPVTIPLDGTGAGVSWGGANDRIPHAPLVWDGLLLVDSNNRDLAHGGVLLLAEPHYVLRTGR